MLTPIANIHHSKLPGPGTIGRVVGLCTVNPKRRCIVESYRLNDNPQWRGRFYSLGIHTCTVRFLDNSQRKHIAWQYFQEVIV